MHVPTAEEVNRFVTDVYPAGVASGMRCEATAAGEALARWTYDESTLRPGGIISGPVQFALADCALWFLSFTILGLAPMAVTSNLTIDFLRPAVGGDLFAKATLLRAGRTRVTGRVDLWVAPSEERIVAHATGSYAMLEAR